MVLYDINGAVKCSIEKVEFNDIWMGESSLSATIVSDIPINFCVGDYTVYRGEIFTIYNTPSVLKQARQGSYGEAFKYDNVKLLSRSAELAEKCFFDFVLHDNNIHYTSLSTFNVYCETVDDYVDRIAANSDRGISPNSEVGDTWLFITPNYDRTLQRYSLSQKRQEKAAELWEQYFGLTHISNVDTKNINIQISNQTLWEGLSLVKSKFGLNFVTRDRTCIIGGDGVPLDAVFRYGKGNGLTSIKRTVDNDQQVVTRLYAYGSDKNMPVRYYANIGMKYGLKVIQIFVEENVKAMFILTGVRLDYTYFTRPYESDGSEYQSFLITFLWAGYMVTATAIPAPESNGQYYYFKIPLYADAYNSQDAIDFFKGSVLDGDVIPIYSGINKEKWPSEYTDASDVVLPDNMAVNVLMLPGFPTYSLSQLCRCVFETVDGNEVTEYQYRDTPDSDFRTLLKVSGHRGIVFSNDPLRPYLESQNASVIGVKEGEIHFTESTDENGLQEIFPTIEGMTRDDVFGDGSTVRLDELLVADTVSDDGIGTEKENIHVIISSLGVDFDLRQAFVNAGSSMTLSIKDGYCGGRDFSVKNVRSSISNNWNLEIERFYDESLQRWFPYKMENATLDGPYQLRKGDHFVLTGIDINHTSYIRIASIKLLQKSILWLLNNDYTRYTYIPKIDNIFFARQHDESVVSNGLIASLHDSLRAGMLFRFSDEDIDIDGHIYIDQLTIKEYGDETIPSYNITLREDKQIGTLQRIQNQINSLSSFVSGGGGGITATQVMSIVRDEGSRRFLSKIFEDSASSLLGFKKGLWVKAKGLFGFNEDGNVTAHDVTAHDVTAHEGAFTSLITALRGIIGKLSSPNFRQGELTGTGWQLTDYDGEGNSRLEVDTIVARMKFVASILETRKYVSMGGNYVFSPAAGIIEQVDYIKDTEEGGQPKREMMGYTYEKVPWLIRLAPLRLRNVLLSRVRKTKHSVKRSEATDMKTEATVFRCYLKSDDGTTATVNTWQVGMLVRCQTFDVEKSELGTHTDETFTDAVQNTFYWREIVAVGKGRMPIDDGYEHHYIDLSNETDHYHENSDIPSPGDNIVCFGSTKKDTSHFIVIETVGADAPALKEYRGVGLVNIHRDNNTQGYTGETPNFNLANCRRTMISPTSGNEFFAPRYYIETDDDTEQLYIEHYKGEAATIITRTTDIYPTPELSVDDVMIVQDMVLSKPKAYKANALGRFEEISVRYGDIWYVKSNGKVYMAKAIEWEERGDYIVKERFAQEVKGDTEQSIATSMGFIDPVSGEPEWENVGEYIRSSTENISRLTRAAKYGKNMLNGTLTGTGWVCGSTASVTVQDGIFVSADKKIISPLVQLYEGSFTFSFYTQRLAVDSNGVVKARVKLLYPIVQELTSIQIFITGESIGDFQRYRATISRSSNDQMRVFVALDVMDDDSQANAVLCFPQLEFGDDATEFASSEREVSSFIKQTAYKISLKVNEGLESTGIDIEHRKIQMTADNFTLENLRGDQVLGVNEAGNLELLGTIFADSIFKKVLFAYHFSDTQAELAYMNYDGTISNDMYVYIHSTEHFADYDELEQDGKTYEDYGVAVGKCMRWSGEVAQRYGNNADDDLVYCTPPIDHIIAVDSQAGGSYYDNTLSLTIPPSWKYIGKVLEIWNMKAHGENDLKAKTVSWQDAEEQYHHDKIISYLIMNASDGEIEVDSGSNPQNEITVQYGERVRLLATPIGWLQL